MSRHFTHDANGHWIEIDKKETEIIEHPDTDHESIEDLKARGWTELCCGFCGRCFPIDGDCPNCTVEIDDFADITITGVTYEHV